MAEIDENSDSNEESTANDTSLMMNTFKQNLNKKVKIAIDHKQEIMNFHQALLEKRNK
jgi:hypothetical protein